MNLLFGLAIAPVLPFLVLYRMAAAVLPPRSAGGGRRRMKKRRRAKKAAPAPPPPIDLDNPPTCPYCSRFCRLTRWGVWKVNCGSPECEAAHERKLLLARQKKRAQIALENGRCVRCKTRPIRRASLGERRPNLCYRCNHYQNAHSRNTTGRARVAERRQAYLLRDAIALADARVDAIRATATPPPRAALDHDKPARKREPVPIPLERVHRRAKNLPVVEM